MFTPISVSPDPQPGHWLEALSRDQNRPCYPQERARQLSDTDSKGQDNEVDVDEADIDVPDDPSTSEDASEGEEDHTSYAFTIIFHAL